LANPSDPAFASVNPSLKDISVQESYTSKELEKTFGQLSEEDFAKKVVPSLLLPKQLGNTYTASLYAGKDQCNCPVVTVSYLRIIISCAQ
jgi:hypothetical protein